jgi:hypothetical protein
MYHCSRHRSRRIIVGRGRPPPQVSLIIIGSAGYPLISHFTATRLTTLGGYNLGGINSTGQIPEMSGNFARAFLFFLQTDSLTSPPFSTSLVIDKDTPLEFYTQTSYTGDGSELQLVFSDEFNVDGRTFYPGDDPYWEAVDLHYWYAALSFVFPPLTLGKGQRTTWNGTTHSKSRRRVAILLSPLIGRTGRPIIT